MTAIAKHTLQRPKGLIECDTVLDIGAGIRPMQWYQPRRHICIEPYPAYCKILITAGFACHCETAVEALRHIEADAVYLLDVIEHMERPEGLLTLMLAKEAARRQVVVYTPHGYKMQDRDAWKLGGDSWQTHRSGWLPSDFPGWSIEHNREEAAFFALWEPSTLS